MTAKKTTELSVAIITYNEEARIADCIESVHEFADEIIVLDSFSTDATEKIAKSYKKVKFAQQKFEGHIEQKNDAIEMCSGSWILSLDADERVTQKLSRQIQQFLKEKQHDYDGVRIPRLTYHMGHFIRHSGWYPLHRFRLFRKGMAKWTGENPHDYIEMKPGSRSLKVSGDILHYSFKDLSDQVDTINKFSSIVSFTRHRRGQKYSWLKVLFKPVSKFWEIYLFKRGFLDGVPGFVIAVASSFSTFLKYAKIYELEKKVIQRPSNLRADYGEKNDSKTR